MNDLIPTTTPTAMHASADYARLPAEERKRVALTVRLLVKLDRAPSLSAACAELAFACGGEYGLSAESLRRKYAVWKATGRDWRSLVNKARVPGWRTASERAEDAALRSPEFLEYYHRLVEEYKRSSAAALRELKRRFAGGEVIPGYGNWRAWFALAHPGAPVPAKCPGHPKGWSDRNLHRLKPDARRLALAREGLKRHAELSAYTPRTTRSLRALELLVPDDFRTDFMVVLPQPITVGGRRFSAGVWPLVGLVLMDVASRRIVGWALRPAAKDEDGVRAVIGRADLALLAASMFLEYGLPSEYPVEFYMENATATFTSEARGWMAASFGDRVRFKSTGLFDDCLVDFREKGGKAWHKGWIEAFFPLLHNELAALPGQIGSSYSRKPGEADDRLRVTEKLLKDARGDDRAADRLRLPYLRYDEAVSRFAAVVARLNARTDHSLEGFETVLRWRVSAAEAWNENLAELAKLPADMVAPDAGIVRYETRMQSPEERFAQKLSESRRERVDIALVAPLMSEARPVTVRRGMIRLEQDTETHYFHATEAGALLREGAEYLAHWSFTRPDELHLYTPGTLAYAGMLPRMQAADAGNTGAVAALARTVQAAAKAEIADHRALHAGRAAQAESDRLHNAAVLRGDKSPLKLAKRLRESDTPAPAPAPGRKVTAATGGIDDLL